MPRRKIDAKGLWQIFYSDMNGLEPDRDVTGRVGASPEGQGEDLLPGVPRDPRAAAALFSVEDDSDQELENVPFIVNHSAGDGGDGDMGLMRKKKKPMVVVKERELDTSKPFIFRPKTELDDDPNYAKSMESIDLDTEQSPSQQNGSFLGNRFRIRRESDLELAFPTTGRSRLCEKYCHYCVRCYNLPVWNTYVTVVVVGVLLLLLYLIIVIAIWQGLAA